MRAALPSLLALLCASHAQLPVNVDLFGDEIVQPIEYSPNGGVRINSQKPPTPVQGYPHVLYFQNDSTLAGELVSMDRTSIVWRRPDFSSEITLPRTMVKKVELVPAQQGSRAVPTPAKAMTLKMPGGNWLYGDVRSENGQDFTIRMQSGAAFSLPRSQVEWLHIGVKPAPAIEIGTGDKLDAWIKAGNGADDTADTKDGNLILKGNSSIARQISPPSRFEISFEMPTGDGGLNVWLQPNGLTEVNCYTSGTINLNFNAKEVKRNFFVNGFNEATAAWPDETKGKPGRVRILYDGVGKKVVVIRNGKQTAEWKIEGDPNLPQVAVANAAPDAGENNLPSAVCLNSNNMSGVSVKGFRVQPWDGTLKESEDEADSLTIGKGEPESGKLETVEENTFTFTGKQRQRESGVFIRIGGEHKPMSSGDARLLFGSSGEIGASDLEIKDGRAKARTDFGEFSMELSQLVTIALPKAEMLKATPADTLVFRNGNILKGKLLSVEKGGALVWQLGNDVQASVKQDYIAGVRFPTTPKASEDARVELRNGDRIRGKLLAMDENELRIQNDVLAERTVPSVEMRRVIPADRELETKDIGNASSGAPGIEPINGPLLDGTTLVSASAARNSYQPLYRATLLKLPDTMELRFTITDSSGRDPYFNLTFSTENGQEGQIQLNSGYGRMSCYLYAPRKQNGLNQQRFIGGNNRTISYTTKISKHTSRRSLRFFINNKVGTVDVMMDGVLLATLGQQAAERVPKIGKQITLSAYNPNGSSVVLSDLSLCAWSGEIPTPNQASSVLLANGDSTTGKIQAWKDGTLVIESDAGPLEIPTSRIFALERFGATTPPKAAARIWTTDGSVLHVDQFRWADGRLEATSPLLGNITLPAESVSELVLSPAPTRFPYVSEGKTITKGARAVEAPDEIIKE